MADVEVEVEVEAVLAAAIDVEREGAATGGGNVVEGGGSGGGGVVDLSLDAPVASGLGGGAAEDALEVLSLREAPLRRNSSKKLVARAAAPADCMVVDSGSEESSSSSSSGGRSRSRGNTRLGAAAGAAVVTAAEPLNVDEELVTRELVMPTDCAMRLQYEGALVVIMAGTGAQVGISPQQDMLNSALRICGPPAAVSKAAWELEKFHEAHLNEKRLQAEREAARTYRADCAKLGELLIPSKHLSAVVGHNGSGLPAIREKCGGIMIALAPPAEDGGPLTAVVGPGDLANVERALQELRSRLEAAQTAAPASTAPVQTAAAAPPAPSAAAPTAAPADAAAAPPDGAGDGEGKLYEL